MSSLEIAELTDKRHTHVLVDVRKMLEELEIDSADFSAEYKDSTGRTLVMFNLPRREVEILLTGYSTKLRAKCLDRLRELENVTPKTALELAKEQVRLHEALEEAREKVYTLEVRVDEGVQWATVKRMEALYPDAPIKWQPLKQYSLEHDYPINKVVDVNYPAGVNAYHQDVWHAVFGLTILDRVTGANLIMRRNQLIVGI